MSSPIFRSSVFENAANADTDVTTARMTLPGTAHKALILLALVVLGASYSWGMCLVNGPAVAMPYLGGGLLVGFVFCLITCFVPRWAAFTAPIYSVAEGLCLGAISALYAGGMVAAQNVEKPSMIAAAGPGLVFMAVGLTLAVFAVMLLLYSFRVLQATPAFVKGVLAATFGIFLLCCVSIVLSFFGINLNLFNGSYFGIGLSLVLVTIASLNLIVDFGMIEQGARTGAPKYMEWYGAFALMVTLIWLYVEMLRLLAQLNRR
jgi:uncharacterized YccA/Bax inhibitor family protein